MKPAEAQDGESLGTIATEEYDPLVNIQKTIENGPVEIVDLPINSMVIFHSYVTVYQRVVISP